MADEASNRLAELLRRPLSAGRLIQQRLAQQAGPYGQAQQQYPFLRNHQVDYTVTPQEGRGYAETWPVGEEGAPGQPRPGNLPMNTTGIQVFKPKQWNANDIAGELLHVDPKAVETRNRLVALLTGKQREILRQTPDYQMPNSSDAMRNQAAIDSAIRGYAVGQWPRREAEDFFSDPKQRAIMDELVQYMKTGK